MTLPRSGNIHLNVRCGEAIGCRMSFQYVMHNGILSVESIF